MNSLYIHNEKLKKETNKNFGNIYYIIGSNTIECGMIVSHNSLHIFYRIICLSFLMKQLNNIMADFAAFY